MKKTMKIRMLSILLCVVMLVGLLPMSVIPVHALGLIEGGLIEGEEGTGGETTDESYCINITNKPGTSFVLENDFTSGVYDLWNEIDSDGTGDLAFNQSFSININDAIEVYNNYLDTEYPNGERDHYKASVDIHNGSTFYVQARILINNYDFQFKEKAGYMLAPYGLDGELNEGCGEWDIYSSYDDLSEFFTMSIDGAVLNLSLDGTVKEICEALKAQDEDLGDVTINDLTFELRASCEVEYRGTWGNTNYTELSFEAISHSLYDKHIYGSTSEYDILSAIPITAPITVNVGPAYEGCYEPVKTEYNWYYEFVKEGYDTDEDDQWYGYFEKDEAKESDVLTETAPSGTIFGVAYGTVDSGDKNYITLNDILNENNKDFINSFIGVKSAEFGGMGQMFIGCTVMLTFADGKQCVVDITKADYSSSLIAPCMHACTVCGFCTVTDEMLPCNFNQMSYEISNVCICEEPSVPEFEVTVESEQQLTIESTDRIVNVVVEKIEVEETPTHSFIINTTNAVGVNNVIAFYNINVFDEGGYPYTLNQWYDEGEELTVSVPVSMEDALALQRGEAALYHILADGTAEKVENVTVEIDGESAIMTFTSDSFSPYILARNNTVDYYGRDALSALNNSTALLYAYDQIAAGVEASAETITVYNGTDAITQTELEMVMDAYRRDYAHHFWLGNNYQISSNGTSVVSIKPSYLMAGTDLEAAKTAFEQKVTDILCGITSSMSEYEKELYLHDKLAKTVTYVEGTNAHNAYGALVDGKAVCEGYAEALQYLLQRVGIQSFLALGTSINPATGTAENHEWNYVKIDGNYYHVDLTWDDQGEDLFHAYFNQNDTVIQEDHMIGTTGYALPVCNSTTAQYFTGKDEYLDTYTVDEVGQLLKDNDLKVHVYIPGTVNEFFTWYQTNIAAIGTKAEITGGFSYGYKKLGRELILYLRTSCAHTSLTPQAANDSTCTADGYKAHYKCSCGEYFEDDSASIEIPDLDIWKTGDGKIAKKGHNYTEQIKDAAHLKTAATKCTEYNVYWYDCSVCDANAKDDANAADKFYTSAEAGDHNFNEKLADAAHQVAGTGANCQDAKEYYYDCAYCAEIGNTSWVSTTMGDHEYDTTQWGYAEKETGHAHKCKYCTEHDTVLPHNPGAAATEEEDQICTTCLIVLNPKTGHIHKNNLTPVAESGSTCTTDGYKAHYKCSCGEYFEDASASIEIPDLDIWKTGDGKIARKGHNYTEQIKDAAHLKTAATKCTEYNVYWYDCSVCDANAKDDANAADKFYTSAEAGDHNFNEKLADDAHFVAGTGANCQDAKEYYYDCAYCAEIGNTSWVSTTMGDHEYDTTQWGYAEKETGHAHKCKYCTEHDAVQPHNPGAAATEEEDQICTTCLIVLNPKTGHIHKNNLTPVAESGSTCTADGYKAHYKCSCGEYFEDASASIAIPDIDVWKTGDGKIAKKGHNYTEQIKDAAHLKTAATKCTEYNVYWYDCSVCDANAKDDANAADKFYTSAEAGDHNFNEKLADDAHFVAGTGANCQDAKEYYYDCAYCAEIGNTSWVSTTMGDHEYDTTQWGYAEKETGHAHKCKYCTEHDTVLPHTPGAAATEEEDQICTTCLIVLNPKTGHIHKNNLTPVAESGSTCTTDGYKAHYKCSCGEYFEDASASIEIPDLDVWKAGDGKIAKKGHNYTEQIKDAAHLKTAATKCTEYNVYWYDCSVCDANAKDDANAADKFYTSAEAGDHNFNEQLADDAHLVAGTGANCQDAKEYYYDCAYCAEIGNSSWVSTTMGEHNFNEQLADDAHLVAGTGANCQDAKEYYYDCAYCAEIGNTSWVSTTMGEHNFNEKLADDAHLVAGTGANCQDAKEYYYDCAYCAEIGNTSWVSTTMGDHNFNEKLADDAHLVAGTGAKCQDAKEYYYDCAYCAEIGNTSWVSTTMGDHEYDTTQWGYAEKETGHAHKCKYCTEHDTVLPHNPGAAATEEEDQICTTCLIVLNPRTGHFCRNYLTKVPAESASCFVDGNSEYYTCSCGKWYSDATASVEIIDKNSVIIAAGHNYGTEWKSDKDNCWNECACGDKTNFTSHADQNRDGKCDACVYEVGMPSESPKTSDNSNMIQWISLLLLSACGVVAIIIGKRRYSGK